MYAKVFRPFFVVAAVWLCSLASSVLAEPQRYSVDQNASRVSFFFEIGDQRSKGFFPVLNADVILDLDMLSKSSVTVNLSVEHARAGDLFSTSAMKSQEVLDAARFPSAKFVSRQVVQRGQGADIRGDLTLRGVTRPVKVSARLIRTPDAPKDNSKLVLEISGRLKRSDFGATGYANFVGDDISLKFFIWLTRA